MGLLHPGSSSGLHWLGSRGAVLGAIGGLHVAAVAGLMHMGVSPFKTEEPQPIQAVLMPMEQPRDARPQLEPVMKMPDIVVPPVYIKPHLMVEQPTAIRVSLQREVAPQPAAARPSTGDSDAPVELQTVDYIERVEPRYPPMAKRARAQGTVFLRVIIGTDGRPREVRVERSSGHEVLDTAALNAVTRWVFRPYSENGVARVASVIVPIEFTISSRRT